MSSPASVIVVGAGPSGEVSEFIVDATIRGILGTRGDVRRRTIPRSSCRCRPRWKTRCWAFCSITMKRRVARRKAGYYAELAQFHRIRVERDRRVQLAGDYFSSSNVNTASAAGERAARDLILQVAPDRVCATLRRAA